MPPALSDYDSSSESEAYESADLQDKEGPHLRERPPSSTPAPSKRRQSPVAVRSRRRNHNSLLSGLDLDNIITMPSNGASPSAGEDSLDEHYVSLSSYTTRGSTNGSRSDNLAYDQKYHPMDEYLRPSQAAKRRAEYGLDEGEESESADVEDEEHGQSNSDMEDLPQAKKRKKSEVLARHQGTRRSSRKTNRNALYNQEVHPQDELLEQMNTDETAEEASEDKDAVSIPTDVPVDRMDERTIPDSDDSTSDLSVSSPPLSTPLSTISFDNSAQRTVLLDNSHICSSGQLLLSPPILALEPTPFQIYEEPLHVQIAKEKATTAPLNYEHDDKENIIDEPDVSENLSGNIIVRTVNTFGGINETDDPEDAFMMQYIDPSSFDGACDPVVVSNQPLLLRSSKAASEPDYDSVLVSPTPSLQSEVDSVLGI